MAWHRCGIEVDEADIFCPGCATPVLDGDLTDRPPQPEPAYGGPADPPSAEPAPQGAVVEPTACPTCGDRDTRVPRDCDFCGERVLVAAPSAPTPAGGDQALPVPLANIELPGGATVPIGATPVDLGRESAHPQVSAAFAAHDNVSRWHARLSASCPGVEVVDLGSSNGTFVDGRRLQPHQPVRLDVSFALRLGSNVHLSVRLPAPLPAPRSVP